MRKKQNNVFFLTALILVLCASPLSFAQGLEMENYPHVKLQSLDKITARTMTFEARVGATLKFGPLYIKVQSCQKTPPIERPESAAFLQIWEVDAKKEAHWVFSGWMFASSPALSPMDHPIYDVWLIDCIGSDQAETTASAEKENEKQEDGIVTGDYTKPDDLLEDEKDL